MNEPRPQIVDPCDGISDLQSLLRVYERQFIIIGSQSIHAKYPDRFAGATISLELDLIAKNHPERAEQLNAIGQESRFHETYGDYADPVDSTTAVLPKGRQGRLVNLPVTETNGVAGLCLDPHDLLISKCVARREKDIEFNREIMAAGVVDAERLLTLVDVTPVDEAAKLRMRGYIQHDRRLAANIPAEADQAPSTSK